MATANETREDWFRKWFRIFDANGDGHIDEKDYVLVADRLLHFCGPGPNRDGLVAAARARYTQIARADRDGDGRVTVEEYLAAALPLPDPGAAAGHEAMARAGFASFDVDGDGVLNLSDFLLTHVAFGLNPRVQDVVERFRLWDENADGRVSLDEFLSSYRKHQLTDEKMPFYFCVD